MCYVEGDFFVPPISCTDSLYIRLFQPTVDSYQTLSTGLEPVPHPRLVEPVFHQIVRSSRGAQMGFYVPVAAVLCRTVRPPEPTMQTTTAHWFIVVFLPLRQLAAPNLFRTIDPCHGLIVQKRPGGKRPAETVVSPFTGRRSISGVFSAMAKKAPDIF
jgi:hypothetical protein